jgi:predicted nuclease of predicted toxin-antitoxin system
VKFLVDESLSARFAQLLADAGHDVIHLGELGLLGAADERVLDGAGAAGRVLISIDTDFGGLLVLARQSGPSLLLLRRAPHRAEAQVALVLEALEVAHDDLEAGAIVVVSAERLRIRRLPVEPPFESSPDDAATDQGGRGEF